MLVGLVMDEGVWHIAVGSDIDGFRLPGFEWFSLIRRRASVIPG